MIRLNSISSPKILVLILLLISFKAFSQNNTWISGNISDSQNELISLSYDNFLFFFCPAITESPIDESGNFSFHFYLSEPVVIRLFNKSFYVIPGDSVVFKIKGTRYEPEEIDVSGFNAGNYLFSLFYDRVIREVPFNPYSYKIERGIDSYCDSLVLNKSFLENQLYNFNIIHPLSPRFTAYCRSIIEYDFLDKLLLPVAGKKYKPEHITLKFSGLIQNFKLEYDSLAKIREYLFAAVDLIDFINQRDPLKSRISIINENSSGLTRQFLLTHYSFSLVNNYVSKDSIQIKNSFQFIESELKDSEFQEYFKSANEKISKYLNPFPQDVLQTILTDSAGIKHTFNELLMISKGKVILLDFWASWCGPCIKGMPLVKQLSWKFDPRLTGFIFISLDKTEKLWREGMMKVKVAGNHYYIDESFKSALSSYLDIKTIPRYVIINKLSMLEKIEARSPEEGEYLYNEIVKLINY